MKKFFTGKKNITLVVAGIIIIAVFAVFAVFAVKFTIKGSTQQSNLIAEGVSISGVDVGSMTKEQASNALEKKIEKMGTPVFNFECEGAVFTLSAEEISLKAEVENAVNKAYNLSRGKDNKTNKENVRKAKKDGINLFLEYSFDQDKLLLTANDYVADKISDPSPMTVEIGDDCLIVTNAVSGMIINTDKAKLSIEKELADFTLDSNIELFIEKHTPKNLTFDEFKKEYLRDAKDAVYTKEGDTHNIEPEVIGIEFDVKQAEKIFNANKKSAEPYVIPAVITYPKITAKALEDKYVNKIMASFTTSFAGSSQGRCTNIRLAASKIDGYVLNPGERFSYNRVVGPRTEAAGFKMAHVYVGNQVVDGIGGGICQVSSALYNAVVMADLKTVSRTNHSIPVNYVPMGRDATVSYGTIDYVFENNKSYPVIIKATVEGTNLTVAVSGTSEMDYTVEFVSVYNSQIPFGTITVEDDTLPEGEQKIISSGSNGSVYDSYRVYKRNGIEYDRKYESKSRYMPTSQKVAVGTKKIAGKELSAEETEDNKGQDEAVNSNQSEQINPEPVPEAKEDSDKETSNPDYAAEDDAINTFEQKQFEDE